MALPRRDRGAGRRQRRPAAEHGDATQRLRSRDNNHAARVDGGPKGQLCGLTACHAPQARERCRENDDDAFVAGVLAEALPRFRVRRSMEAYPVATARRYERVALFTLTGNIGHDLYNGLLDVFSSSLARRFDALFTNIMWFTGRQSWDAAVAAARPGR